MSLIHPKFKESPYKGVDFKDVPYDTTQKFNIFIPKHKDYISDVLSRHDDNVRAKEERHRKILDERQREKEKLHQIKVSQYSKSPSMSPVESPAKESARKTEMFTNRLTQADEVTKKLFDVESTDDHHDSKLKSKLKKDVELAKTLDHDEHHKREIHFDETNKNMLTTEHNNSFTQDAAKSGNFDTKSSKSMNKSVRSGRSYKSKGTLQSFRSHTSQKSELRTTLYFDTRTHAVPKSSLKNAVIENILDNEQLVMTNPTLFANIVKLRDMNLLKTKNPYFHKFPGIGRVEHVYNDFHARNTNPGYSRNSGGNPFCR